MDRGFLLLLLLLVLVPLAAALGATCRWKGARKRREELILNVADGVSSTTGDSFFRELAGYLAQATGSDLVMIAARSGLDTGMRTLAVSLDGRPCQDFAYDAAGTPCAPVLAGRCCVCPRDARQTYTICPQVLGHLAVESYVGIPLLGSQGQVLGLLAVANRKPLVDPSGSVDLLRIFSARAAAELERQETQCRQLAREKQALHAQKLESLGVLAGGIAHDFNNLLAAMLGNLNLAQDLLPAEAPARPHLEAVERILHRASGLTGQMLAYSGRGHFQVRPLDLNGLLRETTAFMAASIPKKIEVDYRLEASLPFILADAAQVQQVVLNFLTNAADAIGDRVGTIQIRTDQVEADRTFLDRNGHGQDLQPGRYVVLEVRDSGCGIPPEVLPRIFEPFFTTKAQGRGLGLSATLGILRGHRAGLCVRSRPGKGSTFQVLFPAGAPAPAPPARPSPVLKALPGALVLVVDDEEVVRDATRKLVERLGLATLTAADGLEALEQVRRNPAIDLVLMDLTMPRMDGREAFRQLRGIRPRLPVVLSSGFDEQDTLLGLQECGPAGFLQKPYSIHVLREKLGEALERG